MELNRNKRIKKKHGDVFKINENYLKNEYFQYILTDPYFLGGDLIRGYSLNQNDCFENMINIPFKYFTYTFINLGNNYNYWERIGNFKIESDLILPKLKILQEQINNQNSKNWYIITPLVKTWELIGEDIAEIKHLNDAVLRQPLSLIKWIQNGCKI